MVGLSKNKFGWKSISKYWFHIELRLFVRKTPDLQTHFSDIRKNIDNMNVAKMKHCSTRLATIKKCKNSLPSGLSLFVDNQICSIFCGASIRLLYRTTLKNQQTWHALVFFSNIFLRCTAVQNYSSHTTINSKTKSENRKVTC